MKCAHRDWRGAYLYPGYVLDTLRNTLHAAIAFGWRMCRPRSAVVAGVSTGHGCMTRDESARLAFWALHVLDDGPRVLYR